MQVGQDVLAALSAAKIEGDRLMLGQQLDRSLYQRTDKVIAAAGGAWNRKAKAHLFSGSALDAIEPIILTGEVSTLCRAQGFGIFFSPAPVADQMRDKPRRSGRGRIPQGFPAVIARTQQASLLLPTLALPCRMSLLFAIDPHL
jgi:hypothetical protein